MEIRKIRICGQDSIPLKTNETQGNIFDSSQVQKFLIGLESQI